MLDLEASKNQSYTMTLMVPAGEAHSIVQALLAKNASNNHLGMQYPGKPTLFINGVKQFDDGSGMHRLEVEFAEPKWLDRSYPERFVGQVYGLDDKSIARLSQRQIMALVENA